QGLAKMLALAELGIAQGVLPPQERPHLPTLRKLGFSGRDADIMKKVRREAPALLAAASSASSMWAANAATVSPGADTADGRVHFTPANLCSHLHRSLEPEMTARILQATFPDAHHFMHHPPLPATPAMGDEGAANHVCLCSNYDEPGLELFVYGEGNNEESAPKKFPARQSRAAGEAIARLHGLDPARTLHVQQNPVVIDQGVFHNDVIAVGNREVLLYHEDAFADAAALRGWICTHFSGTRRPIFLEIASAEVSVEEAVTSYLFNSQLLCLPGGGMLLAVAQECAEHPKVWAVIRRIVEDPTNPISDVRVFDLRESMRNGGGPACLRLRVVLDEDQRETVNAASWINAESCGTLKTWVERHYRDRLAFEDLADPQLLDESRGALDQLTQMLNLGSIYDFQR
ncbi:MAG: N-succinylarginine dihydrolase, partial [Stenotrophobium sp.]